MRMAFFNAKGLSTELISVMVKHMRNELFQKEDNAGFLIEKHTSEMISGKYIEKYPIVETITDPFGVQTTFEHHDFKVAKFRLSLDSDSLIAFNSSSVTKNMIGRLSEFSDFSISLTPYEFDLTKVADLVAASFDDSRVYNAHIRSQTLSSTTLVKMIFESSEDVRKHVSQFVNIENVSYSALKFEFNAFGMRRKCEIKKAGIVTLFGGTDLALSEKLIQLFEKLNK
jgi:hypothetical protein